ncbi:hypothetical protein [Tautonia marina]|uniref:hypothetical protein n=1 Tax=Tautonia marina TaxID=2653855 RepID=UPI0012605CDB|nr:hypothetical protein [Tautonia marina]
MTRLSSLIPLPPWLRPKRPVRDWRVAIIDPDGMPGGEVHLLSIGEVAELVTWLRQRSGNPHAARAFGHQAQAFYSRKETDRCSTCSKS